ncbi:MAG TPA: hypothetical protein VKE40_27180 [Gemmataceae bacterium]|nr:hypothetical protein [Gemmataceae bacterium]
MFRLLSVSTLGALLLTAFPAAAAPRPEEKTSGPAVVGQAKSLNDLLEMVKTTVKNIGGDALYKSFEMHALPNLDPKKLPGIDPKRPFGFYGSIDEDLTKCRGVLLIPVTSEKDFFDMLDEFQIKWNKGKDPGTFDVVVPPQVPFPVSGRIHKEYAYIAAGGFEVLEDKVILDPKDVINPKEKAAAYVGVKLDRIPAETKKFALTTLREQSDHLKEAIAEPELKEAFNQAQRLALRWLKTLFDEGKEVALRLDADTKTAELSLEVSVEGMPKSALAEYITKRPPTTNAFAALAGDDYAQRLFVKAPLFADEAKEAFVKLIEFGQKEAAKDLAGEKPEVVALVEAVFKSLKATVQSGEVDLAAAIRGPNKDGFYTAIGAVHCKEGAQLEKAIKEAVKAIPDQSRGLFKFDAGKIGDVTVHEVDLSSEAAEPAKKIFGKVQTAYFAFAKDAVYAAYGPDGMKFLKEAMAAKPVPAAVLDSSSNGKKAVELIRRLMPMNDPNAKDEIEGVLTRMGFMETMTTGMRVTVEGGDRLKVRIGLNVGAFMLMGFRSFAAAPPRVAPAAGAAKD